MLASGQIFLPKPSFTAFNIAWDNKAPDSATIKLSSILLFRHSFLITSPLNPESETKILLPFPKIIVGILYS